MSLRRCAELEKVLILLIFLWGRAVRLHFIICRQAVCRSNHQEVFGKIKIGVLLSCKTEICRRAALLF